MSDVTKYIDALSARLDVRATDKTKTWWEAYMKHVIPFRGVKMPHIRAELHRWYVDDGVRDNLSLAEQLSLALTLFEGEYTEDKLAGTLFLQEILLPADAIRWQTDLPRLAKLFTAHLIYDWNTCDWFCVKVLGPLIQKEGVACAEAIASWRSADNLWLARASVVGFIPVASEVVYHPLIIEGCHTLVQREERFAKTAVGWILRDVADRDRPLVDRFIDAHLMYFSLESLRNATKYYEKSQRDHFVVAFKEQKRKGSV